MAYVGPGDIVSGATIWYGLRAYNAATAGTAAIRVRRSSDNAEQDISTLTNGNLDVASATAFAGGTNLFCTTLYDKGSSGRNVTQTTAARQPQLLLTGGPGSLPVLSFTASSPNYLVTNNVPVSEFVGGQNHSLSAFVNSTGVTDAYIVHSDAGNGQALRVNPDDIPGTGRVYWGNTLGFTMSNSAWHGVNMRLNDTTADISVDGTDVASGAVGSGAADGIVMGTNSDFTSSPFQGLIREFGSWKAILFTLGNRTALYANQSAYPVADAEWIIPANLYQQFGPILAR